MVKRFNLYIFYNWYTIQLIIYISGFCENIEDNKLYLTDSSYENFISISHNGSVAYLDFTNNLYIRSSGGNTEVITIEDDKTTINNKLYLNSNLFLNQNLFS